MSIEEKANAYDEALEKVKPLYERAEKKSAIPEEVSRRDGRRSESIAPSERDISTKGIQDYFIKREMFEK